MKHTAAVPTAYIWHRWTVSLVMLTALAVNAAACAGESSAPDGTAEGRLVSPSAETRAAGGELAATAPGSHADEGAASSMMAGCACDCQTAMVASSGGCAAGRMQGCAAMHVTEHAGGSAAGGHDSPGAGAAATGGPAMNPGAHGEPMGVGAQHAVGCAAMMQGGTMCSAGHGAHVMVPEAAAEGGAVGGGARGDMAMGTSCGAAGGAGHDGGAGCSVGQGMMGCNGTARGVNLAADSAMLELWELMLGRK